MGWLWLVLLNAAVAVPPQACLAEAKSDGQKTFCAAYEFGRAEREFKARWSALEQAMPAAKFLDLSKTQVAWVKQLDIKCPLFKDGVARPLIDHHLCRAAEIGARNKVLSAQMRAQGLSLSERTCCLLWDGEWNEGGVDAQQCTYWTVFKNMKELGEVLTGYQGCLEDPGAALGCVHGDERAACD